MTKRQANPEGLGFFGIIGPKLMFGFLFVFLFLNRFSISAPMHMHT